MALIGATNEMDATKMEAILDVVQRELKFRAMLVPTVTDVSRWAVKGNSQISFPKLGSFTAAERAAGAALSEQVVASSKDTLDLDKRVGVHWVIDPDEAVESTLNWELETARRAASAHARKVDTDIIAELELRGEVEATAIGDITRDIILEMRETLLSREADLDSEGFILVGVDQEKALLKIDEFKRQDVYGQNNAVRSGQLGTIYGMPVLRHSGLAASTYYMYARSACAIGFQVNPSFGEQAAVEFGALARKYTLSQKYGVEGMQQGEAGAAAGISAHIVKDAN